MQPVTQFEMIKKQIEAADIVSFDIFDTLIKRIVNSPEQIFDIVGKFCGIEDFGKLRQDMQMQASMKVEREQGIPHADFKQIYEYIKANADIEADWEQVKETELQAETDALVVNPEIYEVYKFAREQKKRIIVTSDMYLTKKELIPILNKCGYTEIDAIYISADEHATKYNKDLFQVICEKENVQPDRILHIGDNKQADYENAKDAGWNAIHYQSEQGLWERKDDFWYNLGVRVGGPLYLGIFRWIQQELEKKETDKIFFLARDGYNIYNLFQKYTGLDAAYLYTSRRAMLLAGIEKLDKETLNILPPFTFGQTVKEILEYLDIYDICKDSIKEAGFQSEEDRIADMEDMKRAKQIYLLSADAFLERCRKEREYARKYFESIGFFEGKHIVFDCGWNGSSQYLMDRFLRSVGYEEPNPFIYIGILNSEKSEFQLRNKDYTTFLFDAFKNAEVQEQVRHAIVLFELFFGAPENSVWKYEINGPALERAGIDESYKKNIYQGIENYIGQVLPFAEKYHIYPTEQEAIDSVVRLINQPTMEEAKRIGDLENVDGFANQKGEKKYIAKISLQAYESNPNIEVYWAEGLFTRDDIEEEVKKKVSERLGMDYRPFVLDYQDADCSEPEEETINAVLTEPDYFLWMMANERKKLETVKLAYNPLISVVIPVYNMEDELLIACIESVKTQTYHNWELCLVDDASSWENVRVLLKKYETDERIHVVYRKENGHISAATNDGIAIAKGEFIAFSDCDDVLAPNALYEMAKKLNENPELDFIYSDEDKLTEDGRYRHAPFFKPDWSPDTFMSIMYTNHLAMYRTSIVKEIGGLRSEYNGAQDYDFTLRFMEHSDNKRVGHIPKVLYYWRERKGSIAAGMNTKPYALKAMKELKQDALKRRGIKGRVEYLYEMQQYRVVYECEEHPLISIVIPSKDHFELLCQCVESIKKNTLYDNYEIIVVDNGSGEEQKEKISAYLESNGAKYIYQKMDFNFSKMCNLGAANAAGEYILLLNDDVEVFQKDWLDVMLGQASLSHTGAVGVKLLYPDSDIIQHIGITNLEIGPSHSQIGFSDRPIYYFGRNRVNYNFLAVTAACLMIKKEKYDQVNGLDESLEIAYNDVDFCFKLYEAGYYNVVRNDVKLYHHESVSRGSDDIDEEKQKRLLEERRYLYQKHPQLKGKDPFYSPNLCGNKVNYEIKVDEEKLCSEEYEMKHWAWGEARIFGIVIDRIVQGRTIQIQGWTTTDDKTLDDNCERYLMLRFHDKKILEVKTEMVKRPDVADNIPSKSQNVGFFCAFDAGILPMEKHSYEIGIRFVCGEQVYHAWSGTRLDMEDAKGYTFSKVSEKSRETWEEKNVMANLDSVQVEGRKVRIRGWAFESNHQLYNNFVRKQILLCTKEQEVYQIRVKDEYRLDILKLFSGIPNLLQSGFSAEIEVEDEEMLADCRWGILLENLETHKKFYKYFQ